MATMERKRVGKMVPRSVVCWVGSGLLALFLVAGCNEADRREGDSSKADASDRAAETQRRPGDGNQGSTERASYPFPPGTGNDPRILVQDTDLRITPSSSLHVVELLGQLQRLQDAPAYFDEPSSFAIRVERAETTMTGPDLAALMNEHVFAYEGAPISDLSVEIRGGRIHQKGNLEKAAGVPFSMTSRMEVTEQGDLALVPEEMHAAGLPAENLLDLFGVELANVLEAEKARGVALVEDNLILDPETLLPPPSLRGRVESASVEGDLLHLTLVRSEGDTISAEGLQPADPDAPRFILFRGGEVRFDKLTMRDTDLQLVDADPGDPFDVYLKELQKQLVAGTSHTLPDEGLLVELPDYHDVGK